MTGQYDTSNELRSAVYRSYTLPSCDLASPTGRVIGSDFSFGRGRHTIVGIRASSAADFLHWHWPGECFRQDHSCVAIMSMSSTPLRE